MLRWWNARSSCVWVCAWKIMNSANVYHFLSSCSHSRLICLVHFIFPRESPLTPIHAAFNRTYNILCLCVCAESPTTHKMNKIHLINLKTSSLSFIVHFLLRYFHCLFLFVSSFGFLHSLTHTQGHERKIAKTRDKRGHHHCRCRRREQYSDSRNSCRVAVASI